MSLVVLSAKDVSVIAEGLSPRDLLDLVVAVFVQSHSKENYSLPQRTLIHANAFSTLFMPSRLSDCGTSIKVVSMPKITSQSNNGLPATTLCLDEQTGGVSAVVNARGLTALRTAAGNDIILVLRQNLTSASRFIMGFTGYWTVTAHQSSHIWSRKTERSSYDVASSYIYHDQVLYDNQSQPQCEGRYSLGYHEKAVPRNRICDLLSEKYGTRRTDRIICRYNLYCNSKYWTSY